MDRWKRERGRCGQRDYPLARRCRVVWTADGFHYLQHDEVAWLELALSGVTLPPMTFHDLTDLNARSALEEWFCRLHGAEPEFVVTPEPGDVEEGILRGTIRLRPMCPVEFVEVELPPMSPEEADAFVASVEEYIARREAEEATNHADTCALPPP